MPFTGQATVEDDPVGQVAILCGHAENPVGQEIGFSPAFAAPSRL
jgi:hypothetical protein